MQVETGAGNIRNVTMNETTGVWIIRSKSKYAVIAHIRADMHNEDRADQVSVVVDSLESAIKELRRMFTEPGAVLAESKENDDD